MRKIIVNDAVSLFRECVGHEIDIYGAKTVCTTYVSFFRK